MHPWGGSEYYLCMNDTEICWEWPSAAACGSLLTAHNQWCLKLHTKIA